MASPTIAAPRPVRAPTGPPTLTVADVLMATTSTVAPTSLPPASTTSLAPSPPLSPSTAAPKPLPPSPSKARRPPTPKASTGAPATPARTPSRPPSLTERKFTCTHTGCDKAYFKPSRLAEHILTHTGERPHACDQCDQTYLRASHLTAHLRTHRNPEDRAFACTRTGCDKRFWTATHLRRHEEMHDSAEVHECEEEGCGETFPKSHLLREHRAKEHMPEGSKPFACAHDGCGMTFVMKQQMRVHEKTHDATRYTCSHPSHTGDLPTFPVWSALQAHIKTEHPPTCPQPECDNRTFKSSARLRDHLKVHEQRAADLAAAVSEDDLSVYPPVLAEGLGLSRSQRKRKRRQSEIAAAAESSPAGSGASSPRKLPRLGSDVAFTGKDWTCGHPGCGKAYKTRFARDEHAQAAHSKAAKHKCDTCGRVYRRGVSLKRHLDEGWCAHGGKPAGDDAEGQVKSKKRKTEKEAADEDVVGLFTGTAAMPGGSLYRRWGCPWHAPEDDEYEEEVCGERFGRVYDVRRHLAAAHGVVVDDMGTREMLLADGQTGEDV